MGATLPAKLKEQLKSLLRRKSNPFAWTPNNMPKIDANVIYHRLVINTRAKPVDRRRGSSEQKWYLTRV